MFVTYIQTEYVLYITEYHPEIYDVLVSSRLIRETTAARTKLAAQIWAGLAMCQTKHRALKLLNTFTAW